MLAVIITTVLSPGLDHIPGVRGAGLLCFLLEVPCPVHEDSEGICAIKSLLWYHVRTPAVSSSSFNFSGPSLSLPRCGCL